METWQINLSLIPSIAVVLTSANRMALGITDEINVRLAANLDAYKEILPLKIQQLKRLSISIFLMYLSLVILIFNAILSAFEFFDPKYDKYIMLVAILTFFIAVLYKVMFSFNAYFIRQKQFKKFLEM